MQLGFDELSPNGFRRAAGRRIQVPDLPPFALSPSKGERRTGLPFLLPEVSSPG
jgi:hypothetical protein